MSQGSSIEWTEATWNPVVGCTRVSAGCDRCYAVRQSHRLEAMGQAKYAGLTVLNGRGERHFNGVVRCDESALTIPLRWRKPRRIFVNSMSDLFHKDVPFEFVDRVFAVMASSGQHTFQILTKRPERMAEYLERVRAGSAEAGATYERRMRQHFERCKQELIEGYSLPAPPTPELRFIYDSAVRQEQRPTAPDGHWDTLEYGFSGREYHWRDWPLPNVWLGTSCEDQAAADARIPHLLRCPAAVRFLSCEPLLGAIDLARLQGTYGESVDVAIDCLRGWMAGAWAGRLTNLTIQDKRVDPIHWVIVGGESGSGARPCDVAWVRSIVAQCRDAGVPCFVKQLGARSVLGDGRTIGERREMYPGGPVLVAAALELDFMRDPKGGDPAEWPEDLRVRQYPCHPALSTEH